MPWGQKPISQLAPEELRELLDKLLDNKVPESVELDYKQALPGNSDAAKLEFLKDLTALANASGGYLVFGMKEEGGLPVELCGVSDADPDRELLRLTGMATDGVRPTVFGIAFRAIELQQKKHAIVVWVPRSWSGPHMITSQKHNRFYTRRSNGNDMMTVDELRHSFLRGQEVAERIRRFHGERLEALGRLSTEDSPIELSPGGLIALHVVPFDAFAPGHLVDLAAVSPRTRLVPPLGSTGGNRRYNADGLVTYDATSGHAGAVMYSQVYRNGIIEAVASGLIYDHDGQPSISGYAIDPKISTSLSEYLDVLKGPLNETPPIAIFVALVGCAGVAIDMGSTYNFFHGPHHTTIDRSMVRPPEVVLSSYDETPMEIMRPALDAIWNAGGWERSPFFDDKGRFNAEIVVRYGR